MKTNFCIIYFTGDFNEKAFKCKLSEYLNLIKLSKSFFVSENFEISISHNDEFNEKLQCEFPDGFLYFKYRVEVFFEEETIEQENIRAINEILMWLWKKDIPAIAVCDYEEKLFNNGGYRNSTLPWPNHYTNYIH